MKHSRIIMSCFVAALLVVAFLAIAAQGQERQSHKTGLGEPKYSVYSGKEKFKKVDLYFQDDSVCSSGPWTTVYARWITTKKDACVLVRVSGDYYADSTSYTDLFLAVDFSYYANGPRYHASVPDYSAYTANWWVCGLEKGDHYIELVVWPYGSNTHCLFDFNVEVWY